jgi:glycerophosphodiester phosphodiesterase
MGANRLRSGTLVPAWRENTLPSFAAAAASGASFVEFDVQVTKDGVPVLWHDDALEYGDLGTPTSVAIADLTVAEFEALGAISARGDSQMLSVVRRFKDLGSTQHPNTSSSHPAAPSSSAAPQQQQQQPSAPAYHTLRWRAGLDAPFPRLEQLFEGLPPELGFNIEVKMATPDSMAVTPAAEVERMVGPILRVLQAYCDPQQPEGSSRPPRPILLSSFDPDVCRELRARQSSWPVMFLSTGGRDWHADPRRMSISAALAVASSYSLSGVVLDSGALAGEPEVVALARAQGVKVVTYGLENDDPAWVLRQQQLGVFGVIVDDVPRITGALPLLMSAQEQPAVADLGAANAAAAAAAAGPNGAALVRSMSMEGPLPAAAAKVAAS